jgi:hypothetical protein
VEEPRLADGHVDLRTPPIDLRPPAEQVQPKPTAGSSRRRALVATIARARRRPAPPAPAAIGDALRELNEQRVAGTISEEEFKARKAELFT